MEFRGDQHRAPLVLLNVLPHQVTTQAPATIDVAQAEAALMEHYARLARLAYLLLPAGLPRHTRVRTAHALIQRALPWSRVPDEPPATRGPSHDTGQPPDGVAPPDAGRPPGAPGSRDAARGGRRPPGEDVDSGYACIRVRVVRGALEEGAPRRRRPAWATRLLHPPPLLPLVWGLRLAPHPGGEAEFLLDRRLSALDPPARAAVVLRTLEGLSEAGTRRVLVAAGVTHPDAALATAARLTSPPGTGTVPAQRDRAAGTPAASGDGAAARPHTGGETIVPPPDSGNGTAASPPGRGSGDPGAPRGSEGDGASPDGLPANVGRTTAPGSDGTRPAGTLGSPNGIAALMGSAAFDPCALRARPTDLLRRRQRVKAALVLGCTVLICGPLLGLPGQHGINDLPAAPHRTPPPVAHADVLDPARLVTADEAAWRTATRNDYAVWPARGTLTKDRALLRRALTTWAGPGKRVRVSATPGTPTGAPPGPAQLLYAGALDHTRVVLLYDGLRLVRYAEPEKAGRRTELDVARADGAVASEATAVVVSRQGNRARYLSAPWVRDIAVVDLLRPEAGATTLPRSPDGVTSPAPTAPRSGSCVSWPALRVRAGDRTRLMTDLGEPVPAHLTSGRPTSAGEATGRAARVDWGHIGCLLTELRGHGVRAVNSWRYAEETLPDGGGVATWLCARADTWRGPGSRVLVGIQIPDRTTSALVAAAENSPVCGVRAPQVLAAVLWKSAAGTWYLLAAGSENVVSIVSWGAVRGRVAGPILAVPAERGARPRVTGRLADGTPVVPPR